MKYCEICRAVYPNEFTVCPKDRGSLRIASDLVQGMVIREKYRIEEKIGSGGMATVYRARHLAFNEQRALKVVKAHLAEDEDFLKRFRTEAIVTRKLQHPNAVRMDDLDTAEDGRPFMVMEFVQGRNLRQVISQEGHLGAERAVGIAHQVALALDAAHGLGITHRDIKPDNILLIDQPGARDVVKVLDFGIAKIREGSLEVGTGYTATGTGIGVGTPQYISPEQAVGKHGAQIDGRADLYSLGVVIYEMLTGRLPFDSDTPIGMVLHHIQTVPQPPDRLRPDLNIPIALSVLLMRALEKEPQRRFQTATEMARALDCSWRATTALSEGESKASVTTERTAVFTGERLRQSRARAVGAYGRGGESGTVRAKSKRPHRSLLLAVISAWLIALGLALSIFLDRTSKGLPAHEMKSQVKVPTPTPLAPAEFEDQALIATVKKALASTAWGRESSIGVTAKDRIVTLTGKASKANAEMAEALAGAIPGVRQIVNQIEFESPPLANVRRTPSAPNVVIPTSQPTTGESTQTLRLRQLVAAGNQSLDAGNYEMAISDFQAALALDPRDAGARSGLDRAKKAKQTEKEILQ
jgi:serine/threonine protein kinase